MNNPICPYCENESKKCTGLEIFPERKDLMDKIFYRCISCDAHVGCHPGTDKPLGSLADSNLRSLRSKLHSIFDPLWKEGIWGTRRQAYLKLSYLLGIELNECHIGKFNVDQCKKAMIIIETIINIINAKLIMLMHIYT